MNNTRQGFFEDDQFQAVLDGLPKDVRLVARFLAETGWRKSEALGLLWRHVDRAERVIRIEDTKNGEPRTCPYGSVPDLVTLIEQQWEWTHRLQIATGRLIENVFHRNGKPIRDFRYSWKAACDKARVPDRVTHDLRRSRVRELEREGVSRSVAMALTGHKTEAIYRRYAIVSETDLAAGMERAARGRAARRNGKIVALAGKSQS